MALGEISTLAIARAPALPGSTLELTGIADSRSKCNTLEKK
jgi:hypothetical protein